ncbi:hypothetical protein DPEC_G00362710 [Dallia pectoralis]|nr:hypothetical protein DPEC_G00362710 [Dallia pectoralis]
MILPNGDRTEVGENGVTLSGGQKARLALARAVYMEKDIYLLDDPLAAVDADVADHLMEKCIMGILGSKTRILCTHRIEFVDKADVVILMDNGRIIKTGTPEEVLPMVEAEPKNRKNHKNVKDKDTLLNVFLAIAVDNLANAQELTKEDFNVDAPNGVVMEGYLFKRASNAFKTWNRRWFSIQNSQLVYQKRLKDALTVVVEDLRLCSVKPCEDGERRFCFEVVSPSKSCMLQAESEKLRQSWIQAVQASIASAYREISDNYYIEVLTLILTLILH